MPRQRLTQVARAFPSITTPSLMLASTTSPPSTRLGPEDFLMEAMLCGVRFSAPSCAALLPDQAVGQRRSSTVRRPSSMERPRPDGRHRARLHLLQHAAGATRSHALISFKPTRPVSGVSQHSWRRRGSTPRWVPFGECASRHVRRCGAAATALTRRPNGPLPAHPPAAHSTVCTLAVPPRSSRPPPTPPA